jgi:hypothetical protein
VILAAGRGTEGRCLAAPKNNYRVFYDKTTDERKMLVREIVKEFGCGRHLAAKILSLAVGEQRSWQDKRATTELERHKAGPGPKRVLHFDAPERGVVFQIRHRRENRIVYGFEFEHQLFSGFATRKDVEDQCDNLIRQFPKTVQFSFKPDEPGEPKNECGRTN